MARPAANLKSGALARRVISAACIAPVVLAAVYFGYPFFEAMIGISALILAWEWNRLCQGKDEGKILWLFSGLIYIVAPCWSLLYLRSDPAMGLETVFWLLAVVWCTDTFAFVFGRLIGGPKLAPRISPNKTWSGFWGGIVSAGFVGLATAMALEKESYVALTGLSAAIGAVSQGGDLVESLVKRHFGVKDTSAIIPGHGGLFDRVDGLLVAAVAAAFIGLYVESGILTWT